MQHYCQCLSNNQRTNSGPDHGQSDEGADAVADTTPVAGAHDRATKSPSAAPPTPRPTPVPSPLTVTVKAQPGGGGEGIPMCNCALGYRNGAQASRCRSRACSGGYGRTLVIKLVQSGRGGAAAAKATAPTSATARTP